MGQCGQATQHGGLECRFIVLMKSRRPQAMGTAFCTEQHLILIWTIAVKIFTLSHVGQGILNPIKNRSELGIPYH